MSDAVIREGGRVRNFSNVKKLKIELSGGGDSLWVPESAIQLEDLSVDKNDIYVPSLYGFRKIKVNVNTNSPYVAGKDPVTGEETIIWDGGQTELLPDHIEIALRPNHEQAGFKYRDGELIDPRGLLCTIHNADGSLWVNEHYPFSQLAYDGEVVGGVPISVGELSVDPTVADIDQTDTVYEQDGVIAEKLLCTDYRSGSYPGGYYYYPEWITKNWGSGVGAWPQIYSFFGLQTPGFIYATTYNGNNYFALPENNPNRWYSSINEDGTMGWGYNPGSIEQKEKFYIQGNGTIETRFFKESLVDPTNVIFNNPRALDGVQIITVKWPRYGDGKILTATYEVQVEGA